MSKVETKKYNLKNENLQINFTFIHGISVLNFLNEYTTIKKDIYNFIKLLEDRNILKEYSYITNKYNYLINDKVTKIKVINYHLYKSDWHYIRDLIYIGKYCKLDLKGVKND